MFFFPLGAATELSCVIQYVYQCIALILHLESDLLTMPPGFFCGMNNVVIMLDPVLNVRWSRVEYTNRVFHNVFTG